MVKACLNTVTEVSDTELIWELQQENARLRNALLFYATPKSYEFGGYSGVRRITKVDVDGGKKARKGLGWNDNNSN